MEKGKEWSINLKSVSNSSKKYFKRGNYFTQGCIKKIWACWNVRGQKQVNQINWYLSLLYIPIFVFALLNIIFVPCINNRVWLKTCLNNSTWYGAIMIQNTGSVDNSSANTHKMALSVLLIFYVLYLQVWIIANLMKPGYLWWRIAA